MHLSWILIVFQILVFQIITTQIYGKHTSNYRANLMPSTIPRHFTLYETENDTVSTYYCFNKELFNTLKDQKLINLGPKSIPEARVNGAEFFVY